MLSPAPICSPQNLPIGVGFNIRERPVQSGTNVVLDEMRKKHMANINSLDELALEAE
jgi:hypothetical protein